MRRLTAVLVQVPVALAFLVLASTAAGAAPSGPPNPPAAVEAFATVPSWGTYGKRGRRRDRVLFSRSGRRHHPNVVGLGAGRLPAVNPRLPASCRRDRARIGGTSTTAVLNYWLRHRIDGYQLTAWGEIGNYRARLAIEQAVIADGAVYTAVTIPAPDMANFAPGSSALPTLTSHAERLARLRAARRGASRI